MNQPPHFHSNPACDALPSPKLQSTNPWYVHLSVIDEIRQEIEDTRTYRLRVIDPALASQYRFAAGQFNMLYLPGCGEIAISMSGPCQSNGQSILHTIRRAGRVTDAFFQLQMGDQVGLRGPYGSCWPNQELIGRDIIFVAGGLGLAPLRPLLYQVMSQRQCYGRLVLQLGARTPDLFLYADEFADWRAQGMEIELIVDRPDATWAGAVGVVPRLLDRMEGLQPARTSVVTCGPEVMMHYVARSAQARGIAAQSIWLSLERHMQCAVGLCGHCQLGSMFVCRQGPVFRYDTIGQLLEHKDL